MTDMLGRLKQAIGFNPLTWARSVGRMSRLVRDFATTTPPKGDGPRCLVVITPWLGTAVPWFSLGLGLMLSEDGADVTFVVDDRRFGPNPLRHRVVMAALRRVMAVVAERRPVFYLSDRAPADGGDQASAEIARLARLNTIWAMRGEMLEAGREDFEKESRRQIGDAYDQIAAVFRDDAYDMLLVPGGVYGTSGVWSFHACAAGVRVATYDAAGYGTMMMAADGVACQLGDVPKAFRNIHARSLGAPVERRAAIAAAEEEIGKRRQGSDAFESQIKDSGAGSDALRGGVLIALNSSWDAAALGPHKVFSGNTEWIVETVRHLLDHTQAPVIVRQHPVERLAFARTTDDYGALLEGHFGRNPRLHFIAAEDPINSYALLERVAAVVVHSSTIGIEAAAFGRPVITGSTAYYSGLSFVRRAETLDAYQALLVDAAAGRLEVSEPMREDARLCFYVTQCCNWVPTIFNPADYAEWSRQSLGHWSAQPAVRRMVRSFLTSTPVAELNHIARMEEA